MDTTLYKEKRVLKSLISGALTLIGAYLLIWLLSIGSLLADYPRSLNGSDFTSQPAHIFWKMYQAQDENWKSLVRAAQASGNENEFYKKYFGDFTERAAGWVRRNKNISFNFQNDVSELSKALLFFDLYHDRSVKSKDDIVVNYFGGGSSGFGSMDRVFELPLKYRANYPARIKAQTVEGEIKRVGGSDPSDQDNFELKITFKSPGRSESYTYFPKLGTSESDTFRTFVSNLHPKDAAKPFELSSSDGKEAVHADFNAMKLYLRFKNVPLGLTDSKHKVLVIRPNGSSVSATTLLEVQNDLPSASNVYISGHDTLKKYIQFKNGKGLSYNYDLLKDPFTGKACQAI